MMLDIHKLSLFVMMCISQSRGFTLASRELLPRFKVTQITPTTQTGKAQYQHFRICHLSSSINTICNNDQQ